MSKVYYVVPRISEEDQTYNTWLKPSLNKLGVDESHIVEMIGTDSIHKKMNQSKDILKQRGIQDNDVVVFVHDDVIIREDNMEYLLTSVFDKVPDVGICGVIGSTSISNELIWWERDECVRGFIIQHNKERSYELKRNPDPSAYGNISRVDVLDGLFLSCSWSFLKDHTIDERYVGYHLYDLELCFSAISKGLKNLVLPILVEHKSIGEGVNSEDFRSNKLRFQEKWQSVLK